MVPEKKKTGDAVGRVNAFLRSREKPKSAEVSKKRIKTSEKTCITGKGTANLEQGCGIQLHQKGGANALSRQERKGEKKRDKRAQQSGPLQREIRYTVGTLRTKTCDEKKGARSSSS